MKIIVYSKNTHTPVPILNWKTFILRKLELRDFRDNYTQLTFRVFDAKNINQPLKHYLGALSFYEPQNSVMLTTLNAKNEPLQIMNGVTHLAFDVQLELGKKYFQNEYTVEFDLI